MTIPVILSFLKVMTPKLDITFLVTFNLIFLNTCIEFQSIWLVMACFKVFYKVILLFL